MDCLWQVESGGAAISIQVGGVENNVLPFMQYMVLCSLSLFSVLNSVLCKELTTFLWTTCHLTWFIIFNCLFLNQWYWHFLMSDYVTIHMLMSKNDYFGNIPELNSNYLGIDTKTDMSQCARCKTGILNLKE